MESNWAAENLQVIRTLMERAAVYRRALAPMMLLTGGIGSLAGVGGWFFALDTPRVFIGYWLMVSLVAMSGAFLLLRRQAVKDGEPFWSPPTRRVIQALAPPLAAGLIGAVVVLIHIGPSEQPIGNVLGMLWLPLAWIVLYGCAIHSAGFFMQRGIKLFGWAFIAGGCGLFAAGIPDFLPRGLFAHGLMGLFFGGLHLAYGLYLYFTETKNAA